MLTISKSQNGDSLSFAMTGRLDTNTSSQLDEALTSGLQDDIKHLEMDLTNVDYVSSAGLRVFLNAEKLMARKQGDFKLTHVNENVMEVLEMTGFSDILTIE